MPAAGRRIRARAARGGVIAGAARWLPAADRHRPTGGRSGHGRVGRQPEQSADRGGKGRSANQGRRRLPDRRASSNPAEPRAGRAPRAGVPDLLSGRRGGTQAGDRWIALRKVSGRYRQRRQSGGGKRDEAFGARAATPKSSEKGAVAQLGERDVCTVEVVGSNPIGSTIRSGVRPGEMGDVLSLRHG